MLLGVTSHVTDSNFLCYKFFCAAEEKVRAFSFWGAQGVGARSGFWQEEEKGDFLLIMVKR